MFLKQFFFLLACPVYTFLISLTMIYYWILFFSFFFASVWDNLVLSFGTTLLMLFWWVKRVEVDCRLHGVSELTVGIFHTEILIYTELLISLESASHAE